MLVRWPRFVKSKTWRGLRFSAGIFIHMSPIVYVRIYSEWRDTQWHCLYNWYSVLSECLISPNIPLVSTTRRILQCSYPSSRGWAGRRPLPTIFCLTHLLLEPCSSSLWWLTIINDKSSTIMMLCPLSALAEVAASELRNGEDHDTSCAAAAAASSSKPIVLPTKRRRTSSDASSNACRLRPSTTIIKHTVVNKQQPIDYKTFF